jgi:hypothetical protein
MRPFGSDLGAKYLRFEVLCDRGLHLAISHPGVVRVIGPMHQYSTRPNAWREGSTFMSDEVTSKQQWQDRLADSQRTLNAIITGVKTAQHGKASESAWTLEDVVAHLLGWRTLTVDRLESAARDVPPPDFPWPEGLTEETDEGTDEINRYFFETGRERSLGDLMVETNAQFVRMRSAMDGISESDLLTEGRYPWLDGMALSAVVEGTIEHFSADHEAELRELASQRRE